MSVGLLAILDDVAMLLDDAASMSKLAVKKTAGLLGDDLAVNAEKATGFHASRELPVIWAITKGSFVNKIIILPLAFLLSAYLSWLIVPILLVGGAYLCFEGGESVLGWITGHQHKEIAARNSDNPAQLVAAEKTKIKAAVRTDFILSIEIIVIALGTVIDQPISIQILVVSFIALLATVGVYGMVALLVRIDDAGLSLIERGELLKSFSAKALMSTGRLLVNSLPHIIRLLGVLGTIAMLLVGGGMYVHNIDRVERLLHGFPGMLAELAVGLLLGAILVVARMLIESMLRDSSGQGGG